MVKLFPTRTTPPVVIIGLGRFGLALGEELVRAGVEVLGIDRDEATVNKASSLITHAVIAETTSADTLRQLGVDDAQRVVIGIGSDMAASLLTASAVMDLGVSNVWAKADNDQHAKILSQIGVHHVVRPERDTGRRVAHLIAGRLQDYVEFESDFALAKLAPPVELHGKTLRDLPKDLTVVAVRPPEGRFGAPDPDHILTSGDLVIVAGTAQALDKFSEG